ncbi:MAG: SsrA-binding protein SmpB [Myxococcales bacterium]|nr:SsrA-binding protein SmpB [Myxococcales bacterium]
MKSDADARKIIATNRRARFDYEVLERVEAGIALLGPEVKSLRAGKASLSDSYAIVRRGEIVLLNLHIPAYGPATRENRDPRRERVLLLHRGEIDRLAGKVRERGFTLVPLQLYFRQGRAKVELALARGKRSHDRRETIRKREADRELARTARGRGRPRA